jgi:hypothetical protein
MLLPVIGSFIIPECIPDSMVLKKHLNEKGSCY